MSSILNNTEEAEEDNQNHNLDWRRNKVLELSVKGCSQLEIARNLKISQPTVHRDLQFIMESVYNKRQEWGKQVFEENQKNLYGLNEVLKKLWKIVDDSKTDNKERLHAMALIIQCYEKRLESIANKPTIKILREQAEELFAREQVVEQKSFQIEQQVPDRQAKF